MSDDGVNPFDETQQILTPEEEQGLANQPMPGYWDRFQANRDQEFYGGGLFGVLRAHGSDRQAAEMAKQRYDAMPQWETPLDAVAALAGQLVGGGAQPENFVPVGLGEKAVAWAGIKSAPWMARMFAGAVDAAVSNAASDSVVQAAELNRGARDEFSLPELAASTALGGLVGAASHWIGRLFDARVKVEPAPEVKPVAKPVAPPAPSKVEPTLKVDGEVGSRPPSPVAAEPPAVAPKAAAVAEPEPLLLGEVLDEKARLVRGLPPRETPKPAKAGDEPVLGAAVPQGARTGQLVRDPAGQASVAAAAAKAVADSPELTRLKDIGKELSAALEAVAVRSGRIAQKNFAGIYKTQSGVIRIKSPDDFDVLTHELGHHVEEHIGAPVKALMQKHKAELDPMAYDGVPDDKLTIEGFAEYMRVHVTNPAYAAQKAPAFDAAFRAMLAKDAPEMAQALDKAAKAWKGWLDQPSKQAVASTIVSRAKPKVMPKARKDLAHYGLAGTISEYLSRGYTMFIDDLHPINKAVTALARIFQDNTGGKMKLNVADDAYKLARLSRGGYNAGHMDIMHGVTPYRSTAPGSASLRDAIVKAVGAPNALGRWREAKLQEFGAYLWSRRALGEWERFEAGLIPNPPDKLTKGDHQVNVKESEAANQGFVDAAALVHDWAASLLAKKRDAGLITRDQFTEAMKIKDYVPGLRAFDQAGDAEARASAKGGSAKGGFVKRFQGSRRDVINPIESLIADAYETNAAIARNDVVKALDRMASAAGLGAGAIAERIPAHQMQAQLVNLEQITKQMIERMNLNEIDAQIFRDHLEAGFGDDALKVFRPKITSEKGEPIVFFRDGGELKALRLADGAFGQQMYAAMTMMTRGENNVFIEMLAAPARVLRVGITANPMFLLANFIRDQVMSSVFYGRPLARLGGTAKGAVDELFSRQAAKHYNTFGGIMGGAQVASVADARLRRDMQGIAKKGYFAQRATSLQGILEMTELSETGMRLGLFKTFTEEAKGRGLSDFEAMLEGAYRARDHLDFNRRGSQMAGLSRLIPFMNASVQGLDKGWRQMVAPLFREAVTEAEKRAKGDAMKAWARLSALAAASMALHAINSEHDEYNDLSPTTRATHWAFKWGDKWLFAPKPFELGVAFNAAEAGWDAVAKQDPRWKEHFMEGLYEVALPPNVMEGNPLIKTAYALMSGHQLRTGEPLVPDGMEGMEPWLQFNAKTSELSKTIGSAINVSPAIIDYVVTAHFGSMGRDALALYDYAASDKPLPGWDEMAMTRRFVKDAARGAASTRAFWALVSTRTGKLEGARKSWQAMMDGGDEMAAADYLAAQDEVTRGWIATGSLKAEVRRIHPLQRAQLAVKAINALRREMMQSEVKTADGVVTISRAERGAADDILEQLAMFEATNALKIMEVPGYAGREVVETAGSFRELQAVSPALAKALADRFATNKVIPMDAMERLWPDLKDGLKRDGSGLLQAGLAARAKAAGYEMDGKAMKRKPRAQVPAAN